MLLDISKVSIQLLLKEPFYGHFLMGIPKSFDAGIKTAAVCLMPQQLIKLVINPSFWESLSEEHRYGLLKHEILHIVLKHLFRQKNFGNKQLFNIAADLVVNQYILTSQLPEGALLLENFRHLEALYGIQLEAGREVDYYYNQLDQVLKKSKAEGGKFPSVESGKPFPIDLDKLLQEGSPELEKHAGWGEFEALNPGEEKVMEHQIRNVTRQAWERTKHKNHGNLPAGLVARLKDLVLQEKPQVDWRRVIRLFASSSNTTYLKNTIRRPSKRYHTTPGIQLKRRHRLLVAIDTSGSVQEEELAAFMNEIHHIWRQGVAITIAECDAKIHRTYTYKGILPEYIQGRGGTDFNPVIQLANKEKPDALIYFTDGMASAPEKCNCPTLWVISASGMQEIHHLQGRVVRLST